MSTATTAPILDTNKAGATPSTKTATEWARPHRAAAAARPTGIYGELSDEWIRLSALPHAGTFRKWARREKELAGTSSLSALLDRIDEAASAETDRILTALLHIAQSGDHLAGRTILQAMLPKLSRMAHTATIDAREATTIEERRQLGITTFWEVMAGYPIDRRAKSVAGGLALDTLHRLTGVTRQAYAEVPARPARGSPTTRSVASGIPLPTRPLPASPSTTTPPPKSR